MFYPALQNYFSKLHSANSTLWMDEQDQAHARYFNATLSSAFQTIRSGADHEVVAYEGYLRSYSISDQGLNIWKLLDNAASDDESVELDRLCRLLHTINFFRQAKHEHSLGKLDLYLSVHSRLLAAVAGNHGMAFRRILDALELPHQQIVLQLPLITTSQRWVLTHVAENYRRNGFRIGANAGSLEQASDLLDRIRPDSIKIDIAYANDGYIQSSLLRRAERQNCELIFKRIDTEDKLRSLHNAHQTASPYFVQGWLFDMPKTSISKAANPLQASTLVASA